MNKIQSNSESLVEVHSAEALTERDLSEIVGLVRLGDEVTAQGIEQRIRRTRCVATIRRDMRLIGVVAIKRPSANYRNEVAAKSETVLNAFSYPYELGYLFVHPTARQLGFGRKLCESAMLQISYDGVFATARTNNDAMSALLPALGFEKSGNQYASERGPYFIQLYLKPGKSEA